MRLGLLGGSFNPIHHAHLVIAERAAEAARLDRVILMPTAVSPLKARDGFAPARDRLAMVRAAVRGNPRLAASDLEVRRGGVSYTVETLKALGKRHPGSALFVIIGADAAGLLSQWRDIDEVCRRATFLVAARPGHRVPRGMPKHKVVEVPLLEVSSTDIRERVRRGRSIRYLVPDAVRRHIERRGLYE
ncbi:MAG TPA: nicotinate-nucleotide adenylyltransferase [Planctomycetota bacterium]|nr:nicotinate-nucleotide adenylyltransferase [Planctomycetota bacterium]